MRVSSFKDLMAGHERAEITCAMTSVVVRRLFSSAGQVTIEPLQGPSIVVPLSTQIGYEPWFLDRGSLTFEHEGRSLKICTEMDIISFPDGVEEQVMPLDTGATRE